MVTRELLGHFVLLVTERFIDFFLVFWVVTRRLLGHLCDY